MINDKLYKKPTIPAKHACIEYYYRNSLVEDNNETSRHIKIVLPILYPLFFGRIFIIDMDLNLEFVTKNTFFTRRQCKAMWCVLLILRMWNDFCEN